MTADPNKLARIMAHNITQSIADITQDEICFLVRSYIQLYNKLYHERIDEEDFLKKCCCFLKRYLVDNAVSLLRNK
ncbi:MULTISPECIES: hypothetical protein [unclassified Nitratiruptor]|uniref:hypothetical protein n=1 Tax=unclassified Nitratiruptor TaxID=2624044 RepID=UPI001914FDBD|nr:MULTISPECIES: hypothetical protein [unclassified Nitratiruptor]